MGAASRGGSPSNQALGGAGAVLEARHSAALGLNLAIGNNTSWAQGGFARYGAAFATLGGVNLFDQGSGGSTPNRGYANHLGTTWKRSRETNAAPTNTPIDFYCALCPAPIVTRPTVNLPSSFSVWEVGCMMALETLPVGSIARDCGLVFILNSATSYPAALRQTPVPGGNFAGFGLVYDAALGNLAWICRKDPAAGINETVTLTGAGTQFPLVTGALRATPIKFRFYSATAGSEARVEVYIDNILALTRYWGAGTTLPIAADVLPISAMQQWYRPLWRTAIPSTANCALLWRDEYVKAAASAALLD